MSEGKGKGKQGRGRKKREEGFSAGLLAGQKLEKGGRGGERERKDRNVGLRTELLATFSCREQKTKRGGKGEKNDGGKGEGGKSRDAFMRNLLAFED